MAISDTFLLADELKRFWSSGSNTSYWMIWQVYLTFPRFSFYFYENGNNYRELLRGLTSYKILGELLNLSVASVSSSVKFGFGTYQKGCYEDEINEYT